METSENLMSGFKDGGRVIVPGYLEEIISLASE
jgi:hypothetical protein